MREVSDAIPCPGIRLNPERASNLTFAAVPEPTKLLVTAGLAAAPQEKLTQQPGPPGWLPLSKLRLRVLHRCPYRIRATSPDRWGSYPRDQSLQSCHPRHRVYYYKVTTLLYNIAGNNADHTKLTLATVAPPITFARSFGRDPLSRHSSQPGESEQFNVCSRA